MMNSRIKTYNPFMSINYIINVSSWTAKITTWLQQLMINFLKKLNRTIMINGKSNPVSTGYDYNSLCKQLGTRPDAE